MWFMLTVHNSINIYYKFLTLALYTAMQNMTCSLLLLLKRTRYFTISTIYELRFVDIYRNIYSYNNMVDDWKLISMEMFYGQYNTKKIFIKFIYIFSFINFFHSINSYILLICQFYLNSLLFIIYYSVCVLRIVYRV